MGPSPPTDEPEPPKPLTLPEEVAARAFLRSNLPLVEVPGTGGVRLRLAGPRSGLGRLVGDGPTPYWAYAWPGGVALAAHLAANPGLVEGRYVYDLGSGSGIASLAAARTGRTCALLPFDVDPMAAVAAQLNAEENGLVGLLTKLVPPGRPPFRGRISLGRTEALVLVGDLFYDEAVAASTAAALDLQAPETLILVGDVGRRFLPRDRLDPVACYPVRDVGDPPSAPTREGWVFRWRPNEEGAR